MKTQFHISIDTDDATGDVLAVYFQIHKGRVRETREFADGAVFADYDLNGRLLCVELLGPCRVSIIDKVAEKEPAEVRRLTKRFMKKTAPSAMIAA